MAGERLWPATDVTVLREMWAAGAFSSDIARRIGRSSRSVLGKAASLGLERRASGYCGRGGATAQPEETRIVVPAPHPAALRPVSKPPPPISRGRGPSCCWPMWGTKRPAVYTFCDAPADPGSSYCPEHRALAWRPKPVAQVSRNMTH